ncbi:hypothetical protein D3C76_1863290 [compost metagenome]
MMIQRITQREIDVPFRVLRLHRQREAAVGLNVAHEYFSSILAIFSAVWFR